MDLSNWVRGLGCAIRNAGSSAKRTRRFRTASDSATLAIVDILEARLLLTSDFGDAPDTSAATGANNYQTLAANSGPRHVIDATKTTLFLGGGVDGEAGTQQSSAANLDNLFAAGGRNDEDGVMSHLDLTGAVGSAPTITLSATNKTGRTATLYGWIDINRNGVFENATERAQIAVPSAAAGGRFTLTFPKLPGNAAGSTYARFRLSTDVAAANATGGAADGEVEDHRFEIRNRVKISTELSGSMRIASGLNGGPAVSAEDLFGFSVASIGDIDGNGVSDLAVGALGDSSNRGAVYIMFRKADGTVSKSVKIASELNGGPTLAVGDYFGARIVSLGDIDGDGISDLAIGAGDQEEIGAVYIVRLKADGTVKGLIKLASATNGAPQLAAGDSFAMVEPIGDLDGDGVMDLAIGAPGTDGAGTDRGAIFILRMKSDGTVKSFNTIENTVAWNPAAADDDGFGQGIAALGDLDGDGVIDLGVLSDSHDSSGSPIDVVHIVKLKSDGTLKSSTKFVSGSPSTPGVIPDVDDLVAVGDIDGDGVNDLAVSGMRYKIGVGFEAAIELFNLNSDGSVKHATRIAPEFLPGVPTYMSLSLLGNSGSDGELQLVIGMPFYDAHKTADPSIVVVTLQNAITYTEVPAVPRLTAPTGTTSSLRPTITWSETARAVDFEVYVRNQTTGAVPLNSVPAGGTTFTPSTDLGIGRYSVWVRAKNEVGVSAWSGKYDFVINTPAEILPTADGMKRRPELKWRALAGAEKYEIWLNDVSQPTVPVIRTLTSSSATSFTPSTNLAAGTYRLWVRGVARDGSLGQWSAPDDFSITPSTTITRVSDQFSNRPKIGFAEIPGAATYDIWISSLTSPSRPSIRTTTASSTPLFRPATDLTPGNYRVWVRGIAPDGSFGEWSPPRDFSAGLAPQFSRPSGAVRYGEPMVVDWTEMEGALFYQLWVQTPDSFHEIKDARNGVPSFTIYPNPDLGTYSFWVRAVGSDGLRGRWSSVVELTTLDWVRGVAVSSPFDANNLPTFTWGPAYGATTYEVRIDDTVSGVTGNIVASNLTSRTFTPTESLPLGTYTFQVRGISSDGTVGNWSDPLTPLASQLPELEAVHGRLEPTTILRWKPVEAAFSYDVTVQNLDIGKVVGAWNALNALTVTAPTAAEGNYRWSVRANGPGVLRLWSTPETFTVLRTPVLTVPASFAAGLTPKTINWSAIEGADIYDIWITTDRFATVLRDQKPGTNFYDLPSTLSVGNYRIWVRAVNGGTLGRWSLPASFSIV